MPALVDNFLLGWEVAGSLVNVLYCFAGVLLGTLIGVLPGIGPTGAIAILLPITYGMHPVSAVIMLAGIYYGSQYGGSTTSILVNMPGEAASVVTCIDGYKMARQGRAGRALGIAAIGSFIAGTLGTVLITLLAQPTASMALLFGPPEFFSLILLALLMSIYLAHGSRIKALIMIALGLALSQVGMDLVTAQSKFTFGIAYLMDGIQLVPLVMGLFGISEILLNLHRRIDRQIFETAVKGLLPDANDWKQSAGPITRGTVLGFFLGILPGGGAVLASFASYGLEKRLSRHPERFGQGAIEGVAGPESANNAAVSGAFIPLLTLGIPSNAVMALLLGALMVHGVQPGPLLIQKNPEIFWGTIVSMYIGNVMLLILNLPLVGLWVKILRIPYRVLFPLILFFCLIGAYSVNNNTDDILLMLAFGVVGFLLKQYDYEPAPLVLAFILGPMLENGLRQSLIMSGGDVSTFVTRPISLAFLVLAFIVMFSSLVWKPRAEMVAE